MKSSDRKFLEDSIYKLNLSMRALHRILKIARTIADIDGSCGIESEHIIEAISYRRSSLSRIQ